MTNVGAFGIFTKVKKESKKKRKKRNPKANKRRDARIFK